MSINSVFSVEAMHENVYGNNIFKGQRNKLSMRSCTSLRVALLALIGTAFFSFPCHANAQFTTVFNLPPDPNIGDDQTIGSDTQLNLFEGGSIGNHFRAGAADGTDTNIELNVEGGTIGDYLTLDGDVRLNLSEGAIGHRAAINGGLVLMSGGMIGDGFTLHGSSSLLFSGGVIGTGLRIQDNSSGANCGRVHRRCF